MNTYILTFGSGTALRNNFVRIRAETYEAARTTAFRVYDRNWAFLYETEEDAGVNQFNLTEVPLGTPNIRR